MFRDINLSPMSEMRQGRPPSVPTRAMSLVGLFGGQLGRQFLEGDGSWAIVDHR
jgi:hypothetical protein